MSSNTTHYLKVYFKGFEDVYLFEVTEANSQRFLSYVKALKNPDKSHFFICDTVDQKCLAINVAQIQAVNILWEQIRDDSVILNESSTYCGRVRVLLKDRNDIIETCTELSEELYGFYSELEGDPDLDSCFKGFPDEDGEQLLFNVNEIVLVESPKSLIDEGHKLVWGGETQKDRPAFKLLKFKLGTNNKEK